MKIATRIVLIFLILLAFLFAIIISMSYLAGSIKQTAEARVRLSGYHELAEQLQQNSNDLTRMARTYIMTGDNIHKQHYFDILAIQNGILPRPRNYTSSYWDFVSAGKLKIDDLKKGSKVEPVALLDQMRQAGITARELDMLKMAKTNLGKLSIIEQRAFGAMKGLFPDKGGRLIIRRAPDPAYARNLLYNKKYHLAKVEIMRPIQKFKTVISARIYAEIAANRAREKTYWNIVVILIVMTILFSILAFLHIRARIILPITSLSNITGRILSGETSERATIEYHDEIGTLNDIFNQMIDARIQIEFDLIKHEQSLRTTLDSIGDALIATDIYGNITRINPVAENLLGWNIRDAIGRPLDEIFHIINANSRKAAINPVNIVLKQGNIIGLANHTILISKDGTEYQISDSASPIRDDDGDITGVVLVFRDVSEEYAVRQSLKESEARFKRLFENAEVSIWNEDLSDIYKTLGELRNNGVSNLRQYLAENEQASWDMAASVRVIQVNRATLKLFGADSEQEFLNPINKKFGPDDIKIFINVICAIWDKQKIFRSEINFQTSEGAIVNAIMSFRIPETEEDFNSIPVSIIDITDLKMAEAARRESESRLSLHIANSPLAVIGCNEDYTCVQWNPAAEKIFGYSREEALGKHTVNLLAPKEFSPEMSKISENILRQPKGQHVINENVTKDGRVIICEWFNTDLIDENGDSIGAASMVQDITKIRRAEDKLRNLSRAVEQSPVSIVITDVHGTVEYVNPKFEKITGYSANEVIGKNPRILNSGHTSKEEYSKLWQDITAGIQWHGEFHNRRKDGSLFWEKVSISPITTEEGTITHFVAIKEDITERRQMEDHLRRSQKMEAIGELAGGISHDFNNLLGIIIGNLDLVMRKIESSKLKQQLQKAQNAALRGASLTRRLLNFSHQIPEISSPANVNKIIISMKELIGKSLTRRITFETILTDDLWMVEINTGDFEDMLVNLSLNARDAMPGAGQLIIETRNKVIDHLIISEKQNIPPGEYIEIAVSDTGTGIPKDAAGKIFDPFYTTKEKDKGTGLGLAMVYGFIQRSKGYISFYSEENIGTTFRIYLPRSSENSRNMARQDTSSDEGPDQILPTGSGTILIVDDEEELAFIAKNILDQLGYTTICVHKADSALQILENNSKIDLLFSDVVMAGSRDGFDLAETAMAIYPKLKILLTSGFAEKIQNPDIIRKWGKILIAKPYRDMELARRVWETLNEEEIDET